MAQRQGIMQKKVTRTFLSTETTRATANKNWNKDKEHTKSKGVTRIKNKTIRRRKQTKKREDYYNIASAVPCHSLLRATICWDYCSNKL